MHKFSSLCIYICALYHRFFWSIHAILQRIFFLLFPFFENFTGIWNKMNDIENALLFPLLLYWPASFSRPIFWIFRSLTTSCANYFHLIQIWSHLFIYSFSFVPLTFCKTIESSVFNPGLIDFHFLLIVCFILYGIFCIICEIDDALINHWYEWINFENFSWKISGLVFSSVVLYILAYCIHSKNIKMISQKVHGYFPIDFQRISNFNGSL